MFLTISLQTFMKPLAGYNFAYAQYFKLNIQILLLNKVENNY